MNWYQYIKFSMALPEVEDYPQPFGEMTYPEDNYQDIVRYNIGSIEELDKTLQDTSIFDKYGPLRYLGSGTSGVAYYDAGSGKVVKVTFDETEYEAAQAVMEYNSMMNGTLPHIVQVFDVEKVPEGEGISQEFYILVIEKVYELDDMEKEIVRFISENTGYAPQHLSGYFRETNKRRILEDWKNSEFADMIDTNSFIEVYEKFYDMINFLIEEMGLAPFDIHQDNIGKRADGTYVLMDLGKSF